MEEIAHSEAQDADVKLPEKVEHEDEILLNGKIRIELPQIKETCKRESEEENMSDKELIKVKKESIDIETSQSEKESSETPKNEGTSTSEESNIKTINLQLETVVKELQNAQTLNAELNYKLNITEENLKKMEGNCKDLELDCERLKQEIFAAEERYNKQLQSLQEAVETVEGKHSELVDVKKSFDGLSNELEQSRNKTRELEVELLASAGEVRKFEEISKDKGSHAELEAKRALEFEAMLELSKKNAMEMERQVGNMQEELKTLHQKIDENQLIQETLNNTELELSVVQEKLKLSKSQVADLEQKIVFQETAIHELSRDLDLFKASDEQMKNNVQALESLLSASKQDLDSNLFKLEEVQLNFHGEKDLRQSIEASLKDREILTQSLQEELAKLTGKSDILESKVVELSVNLLESKDFCSLLEDKLNQSEHNISKTDLLLAHASIEKKDLEQKVQLLEDLLKECRIMHDTASQKNLELEGVIQLYNSTEKKTELQLREAENKVVEAEKRRIDLEEQLALAEEKRINTDRETNELQEKIANVTTLLENAEEKVELSKFQLKEYEKNISLLESSLNRSNSRNLGLEHEIKDLTERCAGHEEHANTTKQRSLELEDLIQISHNSVKDAGMKVEELETSLEAANYRTQELEQLLVIAEEKRAHADAASKEWIDKVSKLSAELDALQVKSASIESVLQSANEKERELGDILNVTTKEKMMFEESSNSYANKLLQAESLIESLQSNLQSSMEKIQRIENDLESSGLRESEVLEKFKSSEEQLEHHGRALQQANTRSLELESLHQSVIKDRELKLQEFRQSLTQKESESEKLNEKVNFLEEQVQFFKEQAIEATEKVASLNADLEVNSIRSVDLEKTINDLKNKVVEHESKSEHLYSQSGILSDTNAKLKEDLDDYQCKVNELHELLSSIRAEKEEAHEQLSSHIKTLAQLTDEHSRGIEIHSATESRVKEIEGQLHDAIEKLEHKDSETNVLKDKLCALEAAIINSEEQAKESASVSDSHKIELEETKIKLHNMEGLVEDIQKKANQFENEYETLDKINFKLSQDLENYERKSNTLQIALNTLISEKEDTSVLLQSSNETREHLIEVHASERQKLQSQLEGAAKKELDLEAALKHLQEELEAKDQNGTLLQKKIEELNQCLEIAEAQCKEKDDGMNLAKGEIEELRNKVISTVEMENKILELENKLQLAANKTDAQSNDGASENVSEGIETRSRDLGPSPSKKKSKKRAQETTPSSKPATDVGSGAHAFKFVSGVAVVSIIIGIILGKRY